MSKEDASFLEDISDLGKDSFPNHIIKSTIIGVFCGVVTCLYYSFLDLLLETFWKKLPATIFSILLDQVKIDEQILRALWCLLVSLLCGLVCGSTYIYFGNTGDLSTTIQAVHDEAYISLRAMNGIIVCSLATVVGGMSLGPEAPIVTICGMASGALSRWLFQVQDKNSCRRFVLCGMASGFSVFFGAPLGGSLFALEILHRQGYEYFEHMIYALWAALISVIFQRCLAVSNLRELFNSYHNLGCFFGLVGGVLGVLQGSVVKFSRELFKFNSFSKKPVQLALVGATCNALLGIFLPQASFWGEMEIQRVIQLANPKFNYYFPLKDATISAYNMDPTFFYYVTLGCTKFLCIAIAMTTNFRGGFIFPVIFVGVSFGRALSLAIPQLSPEVACLCIAAGMNVSLTRTILGTPIVLAQLSNSLESFPAVFAASLTAACMTHYYRFISSQKNRSDIIQKFLLFD
eukprot:jgi/Galph1/1198/GphlegSOOS_G6123.1